MQLQFVNGDVAPCGCRIRVSNGHGEYADVVTVTLCPRHEADMEALEKAKELREGLDQDDWRLAALREAKSN
jgi:hypothetical protein